MGDTPNLLTLPCELLMNIIDSVGNDHTAMLRFVCQAMNVLVSQKFGKDHFTKCYLSQTKRSIDAFLGVTEHPVFRTCVREVYLGGMIYYDNECTIKFKARGQSWIDVDMRPVVHRRICPSIGRSHEALLAHKPACDVQRCIDRLRGQAGIVRGKDFRDTFTLALSNLAKVGGSIILGMDEEFIDYPMVFTDKAHNILNTIFESTLESGCDVKGLSINLSRSWKDLVSAKDPKIPKSLRMAFMGSLQYLGLDLGNPREWNLTADDRVELKHFALMLRSASQIRRFDFTLRSDDPEAFANIASNFEFASLSHLRLSGFRTCRQDLVHFLARQSRNLTRLELLSIYAPMPSDWGSLLRWTQTELELEGLQLKSISYESARSTNLALFGRSKFYIPNGNFKGADAVRSGVSRLLKFTDALA